VWISSFCVVIVFNLGGGVLFHVQYNRMSLAGGAEALF
jgi:hypothetical protein